mgnify:FL=1
MKRLLSTCLLALSILAVAPAAWAQTAGQVPAVTDEAVTEEAVAEEAVPDAMAVSVVVKHGTADTPVANAPVFLRAARPRGPFEPTAPPTQAEWGGFTDDTGTAAFEIPRDMTTSGLHVHAVTTYGGIAFESACRRGWPASDSGPF